MYPQFNKIGKVNWVFSRPKNFRKDDENLKNIIAKLPFLSPFGHSRRQIPQWPSRESYDQVISASNSPTSKASPRLMHQQSLEKTHQKSHHGSPQMAPSGKAATENLFELLERCSQRLDDQRCVLPSYFSQVSHTLSLICWMST